MFTFRIEGGGTALVSLGKVEGIPATFIVDRDGKLRFMKVGSAPIEDLEKVIADLL